MFGLWSVVLGGALGALSPLGPLTLIVGVVLLVLGAVLSSPDAVSPGPVIGPWGQVIALAALVALAGAGLEVVSPGLGRLLVVPASVVALVSAGLTVPLPRPRRS